ncbi:MAG: mechanosensitive ion channel family protein [Lachnospiraceae bacterium]|nr:mechanosensitive ion channel family protein [Lachnospiraceae bacterium]
MDKRKKLGMKTILTIILGVIAILLYFYAIYLGANFSLMAQFEYEMQEEIESLKNLYQKSAERHDNMVNAFDDIYLRDIDFISWGIIENLMDNDDILLDLIENKSSRLIDEFAKFYQYFNFRDFMIVDDDRNVVISFSNFYEDLKDEIYDPLFDDTDIESYSNYVRVLKEEDIRLKYHDLSKEELGGIDEEKICNLYATEVAGEYRLVIAVPALDETSLEEESDRWTVLLQNDIIGEHGYAFVWSEETKKVLYHPDSSYKYRDVREIGLDLDRIQDGKFGWNEIGGQRMYIYPVYDKDLNVWTACAVPGQEILNSVVNTTLIQGFMFAVLAAAVMYYVILLLKQNKIKVLTDFTGSGKKYAHQTRQYKLFIITLVISAVMLTISFYYQTIYPMSSWAGASAIQRQKIQDTVDLNNEEAKRLTALYDDARKTQISALAQFMADKEDRWNADNLNFYAEILQLNKIHILDQSGKSKSGTGYKSNLTNMDNGSINVNSDESVDFEKLTNEQDEGKTVFDWMLEGRKCIQAIIDKDGVEKGFMYAEYYSEEINNALKSYSLPNTLDMVRPGRSGFVFAIDPSNNTFSYYPDESFIGASALDHGMKEEQIKDNRFEHITIDNEKYYAATDRIIDNYLFHVVADKKLLSLRTLSSTTSVVLAFLFFLIIGINIYTSREQVEMTSPDKEREESSRELHSAEYKMLRLIFYYIFIAALLISILSYILSDMATDTVVGYVLKGNWEYGVNVFALTNCIIILSRGGILIVLLSKLIKAVGTILPVRVGTILKMLSSLLTYVAIGFLLYQCMLCFGLNPTTLMASTGVIAVVLGVGANSLVGDIMAGIFLLMEGDIQVGDVVKVGDFRGYVMELGIRVFKIYDMDYDDVKIIANKDIVNVVHLSMRKACVYNEFEICYEEKIENVERILIDELSKVEDKSPFILDGPVYIGVSALGSSGVCLKTLTKCHEASRRKVEREVNHIVYSIFQKNNISVPYTQITLHTGDDSIIERELPEDDKEPEKE